MSSPPTYARVLAVLGGVALLAGGLVLAWSTALFVIVPGRPPDPFAPEGVPCCATPDSWGEVIVDVAYSLVAVALCSLVLAAGIMLLSWAARRRWPRRRWLFGPALALTAVSAIWWAATMLPHVGKTPERAACSTFALGDGDWRSAPWYERVTLADGIATCRYLRGASMAKVRRLLGPPDSKGKQRAPKKASRSIRLQRQGRRLKTFWVYENLNETDDTFIDDGYSLWLYFWGGRVVAARGL